jgi:WD40 repeat protein
MPGLSDLFRSGPRLHRLWKAELEDHVISLAWSPSGKALAAAVVSGPITLFGDGGQPVVAAAIKGHGFGTTAVAWRRDGSLLASAGQDGKVRLWDPLTGQERCSLAGGAAWVEHVTWHPSADVLASAAGKKLRLWSADGKMLREYPDHPATISDLKWRPRTEELTSAAYGGVALWSIQKSEPTRRLEWKGSVLALAWAPGGDRLAHGNQDATVHYWILASGQDLQMAGYPMKVREVAWDPTGTYLATGGGGDAVTVWDCTPPGPEDSTPLTFKGHSDAVSALTYQSKGPLLASGGLDGKLFLFQPGRFKKALAQSEAGGAVSQLAWSPDDRHLAVGTEAGAVMVYSVT